MPQLPQYRSRADELLKVTGVGPNAANTTSTNVLDLGAVVPFPTNEVLTVRVSTTQGTGANSKNVNVFLQHSADTNVSNFTNITGLGVQSIAGNATNFPASNLYFKLPDSVKQYIRAGALGEANGGDNGDSVVTLAVLT